MSHYQVSRIVDMADDPNDVVTSALSTYGTNLNLGLKSPDPSERNSVKQTLELEERLDELPNNLLPKKLLGKGRSRLGSVYAYPYKFQSSWIYPNHNNEGKTVVELAVNGTESLVLPRGVISGLYYELREDQLDMERVIKQMKRYWTFAVPLADFSAFTKVGSYEWMDSEGRIFEDPEVLIPEWILGSVAVVNVPEN